MPYLEPKSKFNISAYLKYLNIDTEDFEPNFNPHKQNSWYVLDKGTEIEPKIPGCCQ